MTSELADTEAQSQIALQGLVKGLVQGVFFRASTQRKAQQLGLNGWVRNTSDGHVEVYVCGAQATVAELVQWLHQGPARARVSVVELKQVQCKDLQGFQIVT